MRRSPCLPLPSPRCLPPPCPRDGAQHDRARLSRQDQPEVRQAQREDHRAFPARQSPRLGGRHEGDAGPRAELSPVEPSGACTVGVSGVACAVGDICLIFSIVGVCKPSVLALLRRTIGANRARAGFAAPQQGCRRAPSMASIEADLAERIVCRDRDDEFYESAFASWPFRVIRMTNQK